MCVCIYVYINWFVSAKQLDKYLLSWGKCYNNLIILSTLLLLFGCIKKTLYICLCEHIHVYLAFWFLWEYFTICTERQKKNLTKLYTSKKIMYILLWPCFLYHHRLKQKDHIFIIYLYIYCLFIEYIKCWVNVVEFSHFNAESLESAKFLTLLSILGYL